MALNVPDFGSLAGKQKTASDYATNQTNMANRPNQYNPMGSTTWAVDPATGQWTQKTALGGPAQGLFDQTFDWQQAAGNRLAGGAPEASFGAQQNVIDAWNRLQQPGLQQREASARARGAALGGVGLGSAGHTAMEGGIEDMYRKAGDTSITQGVDAWNKLYQNQLAGFNANVGAFSNIGNARNQLNPNEWAGETPRSAEYTPETIYGAGLDTFSSELAKQNADRGQTNDWITGGVGLVGALGGWKGVQGAATGLWDMGGKIWNGVGGLMDQYGNSGGDDWWNYNNSDYSGGEMSNADIEAMINGD